MKKTSLILFLLIIMTAAVIRLPRLSDRPLHTDEAIHAVKLGESLERNGYEYDRYEYHGPALNYFSHITALLRGQKQYKDLDEWTLRLVPVMFGLFMIIFLWPLVKPLGWSVTLLTALLTAISPVMVFYSRYYIMEILLVAATMGMIVSGYCYLQSRKWYWAVWTGVFMGLMHTSKETCILVWGAMFLALIPIALTNRDHFKSFIKTVNLKHLVWFPLAAILVSVVFFSSFFAHPRGIIDSVLTFTNYFYKAGDFEIHIYPWYWYFQLLLYNPSPLGVNWTEVAIFVPALIGFYAVFSKQASGDRNLLCFFAWFTLLLTLIYSVIPYKTPWIVLGFWHGFIFMAAIGIVYIYKFFRKWILLRFLIVFITTAACIQLVWLSYTSSFKYDDNPFNPWVFSHPGKDVYAIEDRVREVARYHPDGVNMRIDVICPDGDYWPLPWYLRDFSEIGWWTQVDTTKPPAPVILVSPLLEKELAHKLYDLAPPGHRELYIPIFDDYVELRPTIELRGYAVKNLYDRYYYQQPLTKEK